MSYTFQDLGVGGEVRGGDGGGDGGDGGGGDGGDDSDGTLTFLF